MVISLLLVLLLGCDGTGGGSQVSGTLLHQDGSPLIGAQVTARSVEGNVHATGQTDGEGGFVLKNADPKSDGLLAGEYSVTITEDRGNIDARKPATISAKYRNASTSGLRFTVDAHEPLVWDVKLDSR